MDGQALALWLAELEQLHVESNSEHLASFPHSSTHYRWHRHHE